MFSIDNGRANVWRRKKGLVRIRGAVYLGTSESLLCDSFSERGSDSNGK